MEGPEVMVNGGISYGGGFSPYGTGLEQVHCENDLSQVGDNKGKENLAEEVLEDLEEYWEDISDRLMISRMVSDSVVKGMVTAVEEEAAEKIASKELEVANLKKYLPSHEMGGRRFKDVNFPIESEAYEFGNYGSFSCFPRPCVKHEKMREELHALKNLAREQFQSIKKEVELVRVSNPMKKIGSDSELGLGGILQEKQPESCMRIDKILEHLKKTIDAVCLKVDDISVSSKVSLCELQEEQDLSAKLEVIVIESVLRRLMEEFEENLWEQNARSCGIHYVNWIEKFHDVSSLGNQLDAILKSLTIPDSGLDLDHLHNKVVSSHITPPTSLFGENGMLDASSIHVAESYDFQQLKHLSKEGLVEYFNNIITKMKRDHESALQQKTEEYFCLRREYLKERGSFMIHRKDEEFDVLRKKIPEVISKLEDFLLENERIPAVTYSLESIGKMRHRLDDLLSENCQLRDCLTDKENELKCLEAQAADAAAKLLKHSLSEENMLKNVENLNSAMKDSCIKASLNEEVYKCALREQIAQTRCDSEDSHMEFLITQEIHAIILGEAVIRAEMNRYKTEDSDIESLIMEGLSGLIYAETIKDADQELNDLSRKLLIDKEIVICLEEKALEQENELRRVVEEKEKLKREILDLGTEMKQKENLAMGLSILLSKEREQFELASEELHNLREIATQQQTMVSQSSRELQLLRSQHLEVLEQIEADKMEMHKLNRMFDETTELLTEAKKQRNVAFSHTQEMHEKLVSCQAREEKLKKEVGIAVSGVSKMFDEFESRVSGAVIRNSLRLEETSSHLKAVNGIANGLKKKGLMYKQKLERRFADLQMAEAEVDLLGDEVDALLRLLEKIYIALDHYSPVLKHYPGIIEILELVRRELSGESTKLL